MDMEFWVFFNYHIRLPVNYTSQGTHYTALNWLEQEQSVEAATHNSRCSQPSSNVSSGRWWDFQKPA